MRASRIVYIVIFLMACLPIVFFGLRNLRRQSKGKVFRIAFTIAGVAAAGLICLGLWHYTIDTQPALIVERFAGSLAMAAGEESVDSHVSRMTGAGLTLPDGGWIDQSRTAREELRTAGWPTGEPMAISQKSVEEPAGQTWYIVSGQARIAIAVTLAKNGDRWTAVGAGVLTGDAVREIEDKLGFSDLG